MTLDEMHLENTRMNRMREYERMYKLIEPELEEMISGFQRSIHTGIAKERHGTHDERRLYERDIR